MRVIATSLVALLALGVTAQANQCYRRIVEPPQYRTVAEAVLASPEREVADYVPAVTREIEETVVMRPARTYVSVAPAQYGETRQTVEVSPAHSEWRTRWENGEAIGCWVRVPARYAERIARVVTAPAREIVRTIPEQTATRRRTEVVEPAHTATRILPARYVTRRREVLESPARARWARIDDCEH